MRRQPACRAPEAPVDPHSGDRKCMQSGGGAGRCAEKLTINDVIALCLSNINTRNFINQFIRFKIKSQVKNVKT